MDDLQLVRELGDETPMRSADDLASARARFVAGMRPRKWRRMGIIGVASLGLAAAVAAVVTLVPFGSPAPVRQDAALTSSAAPQPVETAVQLLNHAAAAARAKPDAVPRPDQFYYVRTGERESWQSVDGTHDGLLILEQPKGDRALLPGCRNGRSAGVIGDREIPGLWYPCEPQGVYRSDLPTNADAMAEYLKGERRDITYKNVASLVVEQYLPAQQRATLFEAMSKMPDLVVVRDVKDGSGRPGIGVTSAVLKGNRWTLVFDATTYEFLGDTERAIVQSGFVDAVDQRP
ncbi:hypothetical protein FKR81_41500 [Lentzea tibetensis]|uniref:CU044_5270 family protein n=1 Tax=Lentzea tibetensis TaxID=2591470 RepID=A0A563EFE8_9PSEU|nr:CU044_5270 family protein [Lentzea tibetensis]TWP44286.1 hypothetical protein FKR81_41500 [Lentzea tibetensis]